MQMTKAWFRLASTLVTLVSIVASAQAASIGITFGDGTQGPTSGSVGPGVAQSASTWNRVNMSGWMTEWANGWLTGVSEWGWGPFCSDTPTTIATQDSGGGSVTIKLVSYDPDNYYAYANYGAAAQYTGPYNQGSPVGTYNEKYFGYGTSGNSGSTPTVMTISGIPYGTYDLYIGGEAWHVGSIGGTVIGQSSVFTGLSGDIKLYAEHGHPYDNMFRLSYIQIVEAGSPPTTTTTTTSTTTTTTAAPPAITGVEGAGNDVVLQWSATNAGSYRVQGTPALLPVAWSNLPGMGPIPGSNGTLSATDTNAGPQKFYRVLWTY
jgi:hypothetical protein